MKILQIISICESTFLRSSTLRRLGSEGGTGGGGGARGRDKRPDWERCRDWLADEKVTSFSAKTPNLQQLKSEHNLYTYLRVGDIHLSRFEI